MTRIAHEVNFDGIVGPTHNYAGLSFGNIASQTHALSVSRPREAALQGLAKMKYLADLGLRQAVLPPQPRPHLATLARLGFSGREQEMLEKAGKQEPRLLAAVYSASSMWAANAATVSPSADASDGRVHFTPANLVTQFHRSLEPVATAAVLKAIFADESAFAHHEPLPSSSLYADEGAANHTRLSDGHGSPGIEMLVHGRGGASEIMPRKFPGRETLEACAAIARLHQLDSTATVFARQHPDAIDAGVFHNDVVAVGNGNVLLYHASAYLHSDAVMEEIARKFASRSSERLHLIAVSEQQVPLKQAVETYLFNSQLVTLPDGSMSLIAPIECRQQPQVARFIEELIGADNPIRSTHFLDVRQSMMNGGGPACLRLRVVLTEDELKRVHPGIFLTDALYLALVEWVNRHYREEICAKDLADPALARESREALADVYALLGLEDLAFLQQ
jgi:succinylarginine dihydrolase